MYVLIYLTVGFTCVRQGNRKYLGWRMLIIHDFGYKCCQESNYCIKHGRSLVILIKMKMQEETVILVRVIVVIIIIIIIIINTSCVLVIRSIHSLVFCLEGRAWQEPEPSHVTGMALAHCILGKFLGVVFHHFPLPLDVPTLAARCLRPLRRDSS